MNSTQIAPLSADLQSQLAVFTAQEEQKAKELQSTETTVSEEDLQAAFANTNFGDVNIRQLLAASVLKKASGFHCGHMITTIMLKLGLTSKNGGVTTKGRKLLGQAYYHVMINGG